MTFDGTDVDVDELKVFSAGAHERAQDTTTVANAVDGVHLGSDMLGFFSAMFLDSAREDQREIVSKVRTVAATLSADGAVAATNADDFDDTNTTQADRFREESR